MKRVRIKITESGDMSWRFVVQVDGEEFAEGVCREYIDAVHQAHGYAASLWAETKPLPQGADT